MTVQFSPVLTARGQSHGGGFSVLSLDLAALGVHASPLVTVDDFRVRGRPFGPHPHAGFSAITYVFEDSPGAVRSRDSLGNDIVMGPGGIVWSQAGSGMMHEETPAQPDRELHGLQLFVNLSSKNKLLAPQVLSLEKEGIPEFRSREGDRVRIVVGAYEGLFSPLSPAEPFTFLDIELRHQVSFDLEPDHNALIYALNGAVIVSATGSEQKLASGRAVGLYGSGGRVTLATSEIAHVLLLSGAEIHEPVLSEGPFIMSERSQLEAAVARYRAGAMGRLMRSAGG
jgi:redox-sensitive bicupin YhaK (pirin superfamily)